MAYPLTRKNSERRPLLPVEVGAGERLTPLSSLFVNPAPEGPYSDDEDEDEDEDVRDLPPIKNEDLREPGGPPAPVRDPVLSYTPLENPPPVRTGTGGRPVPSPLHVHFAELVGGLLGSNIADNTLDAYREWTLNFKAHVETSYEDIRSLCVRVRKRVPPLNDLLSDRIPGTKVRFAQLVKTNMLLSNAVVPTGYKLAQDYPHLRKEQTSLIQSIVLGLKPI